MSLVHYGVTQDSRIILSVKDVETCVARAPASVNSLTGNISSASSSTASSSFPDGGACSAQIHLQKELRTLLVRHFRPEDVDKVAAEFSKVRQSVPVFLGWWEHW